MGTVQRVNVRHCARFYGNRSNLSWDMAIFRFFKMAAISHLGFVMIMFETPMKSIWWYFSTPHHSRFMALFPGPAKWASASRELLDFTFGARED